MAGDGKVKITTELDNARTEKSMAKFSEFAKRGLGGIQTAAKVAAGAITAVSAGFATAGGAAIKVGAEFEAGMSQVQAISGATADEMDRLTEKAKEMGAKTKFSAAESAQAMNFMAMAGWKTEDMLGGIEGIMNLAAASGEDLATTSDIVTDALTAFGLSASDSSHFADVLAKASSNANTNVGMMGETFKYVAPVAGTLGFSAEDTALAIGLMANSGIKASQAGTSLRSALTRLVKPTDDMQATMVDLGLATQQVEHVVNNSKIDKLQSKIADKTAAVEKAQISYNTAVSKYGAESAQAQKAAISLESAQRKLAETSGDLSAAQAGSNEVVGIQNTLLTDSEGNMRSFREVISKLRESFKGMSAEQQAQAATTLFGQEAMSGMLAVINASDKDFQKLASSIDNADGAAADMAETMQDNLSGQLTIFKSSMEGLGLEIYQGMQEPLKDAAKAGIDYVNQLTDAFKADGLHGLVEKAGDIFGELATKAAQKAPQMIDAAVDFIKSFAEGIYKNRHEIFNAAGDIAKSLADGLADLLPRSVRKPVKDAVKEISKSLSSGGLKKAVETVAKLFKGIGDAAGKVAKTVLPPFVKILDFAGEHVDTLAVAVAGCVAAYAGYSIVTGITTAVKASSAAFKASAIAMELLKLKTGEATIAQTAYNLVLNANPIGLVIAAVAALAAGYAALKLTTDDVVTAEEMEAQRFDEIAGKISDQKQSWEDLQEAKKVEIDSNMALVDKTKDLWGELQTIVDANGKIKEGYEDRAAFVAGELSNSLDVEIEMTDGVIQKYGELSRSMDDLIEKKKAKILLDANEESYAEALKNTYEAEMNQAEAKRAVDEQALTVAQKQKEYNDALAKSQKAVAIGSLFTKDAKQHEADAAYEAWQKEKKDLAEKEQAYDDSTNTVLDYYKTVSDYTKLSAAIESNNSAEMQKAIESVTTSRKEATASNASELARQLENQRTHIDILRQEYVAGEKGVTEDRVASAEAREVQLKLQYDKEVGNVDAYTADVAGFIGRMTTDLTDEEAEQLGVWQGMVADAELHGREISDETKKMVDTVIANIDDMPPQTRETMKNAMIPMLEEMKNAEPGLYEKAKGIANGILARLRAAFRINSPSKATRKIFRYVMEGAELGLEDERNNLNRQTDEISSGLLDRLKNIDVSGWMNRIYGAMDSYQEVLSPSVQLAHATGRTASKTAAGNASQAIDYGRMGKEMQKALNGVQVAIDGRRAGEILSPIVDKQLGEAEKWKGRG